MSLAVTFTLWTSTILLTILSVFVFFKAPFSKVSTILLVTTAVLWIIMFGKAIFDEFILNTNYQIALGIIAVLVFFWLVWRRKTAVRRN